MFFPFFIPLWVCVCIYVCQCLCSIGFWPVWHIWMCLARPKFLNTNPQALHNPPLLCNDCCSSLAEFALSSFSCPTPCRPSSFTIAAPECFLLPVSNDFNQLSCETPASRPGTSEQTWKIRQRSLSINVSVFGWFSALLSCFESPWL